MTKRSRKEPKEFISFEEARIFARYLNCRVASEWHQLTKPGGLRGIRRPKNIPSNPDTTYKGQGWKGWVDFLGTGSAPKKQMLEFKLARKFARKFARSLKLNSSGDWQRYSKGEIVGLKDRPRNIPSTPALTYARRGWKGWHDWLAASPKKLQAFKSARAFSRSLGLKRKRDWNAYCAGSLPEKPQRPSDIPRNPGWHYKNEGWSGWKDWLLPNQHASYAEARAFVRLMGIENISEWRQYCAGELPLLGNLPADIPPNPEKHYRKTKEWVGWGDSLGSATKGKTLKHPKKTK